MIWHNPLAFLGLLTIALPVIAHLLRRRPARRVVFPTVRFVTGLDQSSARLRAPSDVLLLVVRSALLALAATALAQPLWLSQARAAAGAGRTARAVIVDDSESARGAITSGTIERETASADLVTTIVDPDLRAGLARATAWLLESPPASREIVVLSDFQRGALAREDVARVPEGIGVRLRPMTTGLTPREPPDLRVLTPEGVRDVRMQLDDERSTVSYSTASAVPEGLQILASPADAAGIAALQRVVAAAGAHAPSTSRPIVIRFPGAEAVPPTRPAPGEWTFGAGQRLLRSPELSSLPLEVYTSNGRLVVDVQAPPQSLEAAIVVKAALDARSDPSALDEHEVARLRDETLAAWSRPPGPPDADAWRRSDESDGRWLWAAVLALLAVEGWLRRTGARADHEVEARAA